MTHDRQAFTLLEVLISLAILASLTVAVSMLLRSSSTLKASIAKMGNVNHRLQFAMGKINRDLSHAFMVHKTDLDRRTSALFVVDKEGISDSLKLTTFTHVPKSMHSKESDMTYVIYRVQKDEDSDSALTHLYRGEAVRVPESFNTNLDMSILAKGVKAVRFKPWDGARWMEERWNSKQRGFRNAIPHMVQVQIEAYEDDELGDNDSLEEIATISLSTVVFNHYSINFAQIKSLTSPIVWF